jgi:hypothetical protein
MTMTKPQNWNPRPVNESRYEEHEDDQLGEIADKREALMEIYRDQAESFESNRDEWREYAQALEAQLAQHQK